MIDTPVSPLAPATFPEMQPIAGVRLAAGGCGIRYKGRTDLLLVEMSEGTQAAGVYTKSLTASAPVEWCRKALAGGEARGLVVNSGNANAFTGRKGISAVERIVDATADLLGCRPTRIFAASTGVIGEPLPFEKVVDYLPSLYQQMGEAAWAQAARAIMTTDTFAKGATATAKIGDVTVTLNGIAKGSGMIAPNMATMLAYVFTDAAIPAPILQALLSPAVDKSFNSITVDSDTSTSDSLMLFATGAADNPEPTSADDAILGEFRAALDSVLLDLAHQVVRDGEGATKFITITVTGAEHDQAAKRIGLAIANSPLVKTAIAGEDANWGRIVMAVGKAGERADRDKLLIKIGGVRVAEDGLRVEGYDEAPVVAHMKGETIEISVDVGIGQGTGTVWTCDLTHGYIAINADYRS